MKTVIDIASALLACPSVTPKDAGCEAILRDYLMPLGFTVETMTFGEVTNIFARIGTKAPLFVFAGHTDVVPAGLLSQWDSPPFEPQLRQGALFARGVCDMKGAIAAMLYATKSFLSKTLSFNGSIAFLITSDEEGPSIDGTVRVIEVLEARGEKIDYCVIGEPSSKERLGDQIRVGRRGSLHGKLTVAGKQGHVAHPHLALNAIHSAALILQPLVETEWDQGNADFPSTSFQITNIHGGTGALNVIPGELLLDFNFRFGTASTVESLKQRVHALLDAALDDYQLDWTLSASPFLTVDGKLRRTVIDSVEKIVGYKPLASTGGGTSDGRFIAKTGAEIVELGLLHETAHQVNEHVSAADIESLAAIYEDILSTILVNH